MWSGWLKAGRGRETCDVVWFGLNPTQTKTQPTLLMDEELADPHLFGETQSSDHLLKTHYA